MEEIWLDRLTLVQLDVVVVANGCLTVFRFVPVALSSVRHLRSMPAAIDGDTVRPTAAEAGPEAEAGAAGGLIPLRSPGCPGVRCR